MSYTKKLMFQVYLMHFIDEIAYLFFLKMEALKSESVNKSYILLYFIYIIYIFFLLTFICKDLGFIRINLTIVTMLFEDRLLLF